MQITSKAHIPTRSLQLGPVGMGQKEFASHGQFGEVELWGDGLIDNSFKSMEGHQDVSRWRDLGDSGLISFLGTAGKVATNTLVQARARFEAGEVPDWQQSSEIEKGCSQELKQALADSQIPSGVYVTLDDRGVLSKASVHLHGRDCTELLQTLSIIQDQNQFRAEITSHREDGAHKLVVPFGADGRPNLEGATEQLTLNTPWLSSRATKDVSGQGLKDLEDPRLGRIAEAASQGFVLPAEAMGPGWKSSNEGDRQVWTTSGQQVVIDPADRSFAVTASSWHTGHAGSSDYSVDYQVKEKVQWKEGRFDRLPVEKD